MKTVCELCTRPAMSFYQPGEKSGWYGKPDMLKVRCELHQIRTTSNKEWQEISREEYLVAGVMQS